MIQVLMARREEIDSRDNAVDKQHDLPVHRRVHCLLTLLAEQPVGEGFARLRS